ncbi:MAG: hypothetical protein QXS93_01070 [Candidatus Micrarchaeia archaeon]
MTKSKKPDPEEVRIQVTFLRTCTEKLAGGKYDKELTEAVTKAKAEFPRLAPKIEELEKICRQEDAASLGIVLAGELKYGLESELMMEECLGNAKTIIDDWITVSNLVKNSGER